MRRFAAIAVLLTLCHVSYGQSHMRLEPQEPVQNETLPPIGHITDILTQREDARLALESYHEGRRLGLQSATKTGEAYEVGETRQFYVHVLTLEATTREKKNFELKQQSSVANIWVELGELQNGNVKDEVLADLSHALLTATPERSYNPNQGIIANNNEVFGNPPNADRDPSPVVDILLYDIPDQNQGSTLAGFVWSGDLCTAANSGLRGCSVQFSNQADVLYLDTNPLLTQYPVETLLGVAAHEYQHLIHYAYDESEELFVNEGLSEWAERMNGYTPRTISYLSAETERNISLFTWRDNAENLKDYQRSGLFTAYLAERLGDHEIGKVVRRKETGSSGYHAVLEGHGLTFEEIVLDFHTANLLNDVTVAEGRYGYSDPNLQNLAAPVSPARVYSGRAGSVTPPSNFTVNGGGSIYVMWEHVSDFVLSLNLSNAVPLDYNRAGARVILKSASGDVRVEKLDVVPGGVTKSFDGSYDAIMLVAGHVKPVSSAAIGVSVDKITYEFSAAWGGSQQIESELVQYDQGQVNGTFGFFVLDSGGQGVLANRFRVPSPEVVLGRVYISPYFLSQFSNGNQPPEAPRDVELIVWADDGNGMPGAQLFARSVVDERNYPDVLQGDYEIRFQAVDLLQEALTNLPEVIYIGYSDTGSDANYQIMGLADYAVENVSFIGEKLAEGIEWSELWDRDIVSRDGEVTGNFSGKALPIRAEFLTGVQVDREEEAELPEGIRLAQNFPNPFNPATRISYSIRSAGQVRLGVYDVTGRLVTSLVDQTMPSGDHTVHFDASAFASGVYMYVLETGGIRIARKMLLLK